MTTGARKTADIQRRTRAERVAREILDAVGDDPEALAVVMAAARLLAKRSIPRR